MGNLSNSILVNIVGIIVGSILLDFIARVVIGYAVRRSVKKTHGRTAVDVRKQQKTLIAILRTTTTGLIWLFAICAVLTQLGVNVGALLTGAGIVGVFAGLSAQNTVRDLLAGIFILFEKPYRVGDVITLSGGTTGPNGAKGTVEEITLRITKLRDVSGTLVTVRNGDPTVVTNQTYSYSNVILDVKFSYDSSIAAVQKIMNAVGTELAEDEKWKEFQDSPIQFLRVDNFTDTGVVVRATGMVSPASQWEVAGEYRQRLLEAVAKQSNVQLAYTATV